MEHFVVGAGSMTDSLGTVPSAASLLWSGTGYSAFGAMSAKKDSLTIQYVNMNGEIYRRPPRCDFFNNGQWLRVVHHRVVCARYPSIFVSLCNYVKKIVVTHVVYQQLILGIDKRLCTS